MVLLGEMRHQQVRNRPNSKCWATTLPDRSFPGGYDPLVAREELDLPAFQTMVQRAFCTQYEKLSRDATVADVLECLNKQVVELKGNFLIQFLIDSIELLLVGQPVSTRQQHTCVTFPPPQNIACQPSSILFSLVWPEQWHVDILIPLVAGQMAL
jgi:hypothetical protein